MVSDWREYEPLAPYTTLQVGGQARYLTRITSEEQLHETVVAAKERALPFVVLGGGSNVLVPDGGYDGVVIVMATTGISEQSLGDQVLVTAQAGMLFDELVASVVAKGYWGLENLSHIPGTVGATPVQNVGAYGVEVSDLIASVTIYDTEREVYRTLTAAECQFGYRTSRFKTEYHGRVIVTAVTFRLECTPKPRIQYADLARWFGESVPDSPAVVRDAVMAVRSAKFPDWHQVGTAGSFFKNPIVPNEIAAALVAQYPALPFYPYSDTHVKCSLGFILDKVCGLRGFRDGHVRLFEAQALVLVAERGATATEIDAFANQIAARVCAATGIVIEREVQTL